jgi:hypothetical protein
MILAGHADGQADGHVDGLHPEPEVGDDAVAPLDHEPHRDESDADPERQLREGGGPQRRGHADDQGLAGARLGRGLTHRGTDAGRYREVEVGDRLDDAVGDDREELAGQEGDDQRPGAVARLRRRLDHVAVVVDDLGLRVGPGRIRLHPLVGGLLAAGGLGGGRGHRHPALGRSGPRGGLDRGGLLRGRSDPGGPTFGGCHGRRGYR